MCLVLTLLFPINYILSHYCEYNDLFCNIISGNHRMILSVYPKSLPITHDLISYKKHLPFFRKRALNYLDETENHCEVRVSISIGVLINEANGIHVSLTTRTVPMVPTSQTPFLFLP